MQILFERYLHAIASRCKAGDKCLFPHHKVDEQPNKKPKESDHSQKRRESDDKNAVAFVKFVPQLGCVSQDSEAVVYQRGEHSGRNPMQKVLGPIRRIRFTQSTLRQASIPEQNGPSLGKMQVKKSSSAKSLRYEIWGPVPWRGWKTTAMRPKQGMEPCQTHIQAQRERQGYIPLSRKNGSSRLRKPKSRRKESLWWIQELVHMVSEKDHNSAELQTVKISRNPTTCKAEKKPRYMSKNWTYSWRLCFLKKLPQFFLSGSSARIMGTFTTRPVVKNHISPKMARKLIAIFRTMCHPLSLVYRRVPLQHLHQLLQHLHQKILYLT